MSILLLVDVLDDSDFMMMMISLSVAVLCNFDLMLLLLDCLWKKNAAWTLLLFLMFVMGNEKGETIKLEDDAKKTNAVQ